MDWLRGDAFWIFCFFSSWICLVSFEFPLRIILLAIGDCALKRFRMFAVESSDDGQQVAIDIPLRWIGPLWIPAASTRETPQAK